MLNGTFTPTAEAKALSKAPHFNHPSTPVTIRFSSSTGLPAIPDTEPNAQPRGLAVRFMYDGPHKHTDIIGHSTPFFPTSTGHEFLEFFQTVVIDGKPGDFFPSHPAALAFVQAPKPFPVSFATETYYALSAFKLVSAEGKEQFVRYRIKPVAGEAHLDEAAMKEKGTTYLFDELHERVSKGPISLKVFAQLAEEGDPTNDITKHWPEDRKQVDLGTVVVDRFAENNENEQKHLIFDPVPRVDGIEPSDDPLLDFRASLYLISGRERRKA